MSRSNYSAICLKYLDRSKDVQRLLAENGFKETVGDYEYLWKKENPETNFATYVKTEYMSGVFVFSVWLTSMSDKSNCERCIEALGQHSPEVKDAENIIAGLLNLFKGKLKKIECYIYESGLSEEIKDSINQVTVL